MSKNDIWYYTYTLNSLNGVARCGALLRIDEGFGAIQPWIQYGDADLHTQLESIRNNTPTSLAARSLFYIDIDRKARANNDCLFKEFSHFESHIFISSLSELSSADIVNAKFIKIKIKDDSSIATNINQREEFNSKLIRLDANADFSFETFCQFWDRLSPTIKNNIDYVEDPCPYNPKDWHELSTNKGVPIAYDFYGDCNVVDFYKTRIIKPVVQPVDNLVKTEIARGNKVCITSALDHPFGVSIAAWEYINLRKQYGNMLVNPGLSSFVAYDKDSFSEQIWGSDNQFKPSNGTGFGFDDLLKSVKWQRL